MQQEIREAKVGDEVWFKKDTEQWGTIVKIKRGSYGKEFLLEAPDCEGFDGDYIGGDETTWVYASDCWA
jgi:hypothetical protein